MPQVWILCLLLVWRISYTQLRMTQSIQRPLLLPFISQGLSPFLLVDDCPLVLRTVRNCIRSLTLSSFSRMAVLFILDLAASLLRNTFPMLDPSLHTRKDIMSPSIYWKLPTIPQSAYSSHGNLILAQKKKILEVHLRKTFLFHQFREVIVRSIGMPQPSWRNCSICVGGSGRLWRETSHCLSPMWQWHLYLAYSVVSIYHSPFFYSFWSD